MRFWKPGVTDAPRVLASTTSHKHEPLLLSLEVFSRLGLRDIDLNLRPLMDEGLQVQSVVRAVQQHGLRVWGLAGGWCDFYHPAPDIVQTFDSVARQVAIARALGVYQIRLFFGRLHQEHYSPARREMICGNLSRLSDAYPDILFVFENHDGASLMPRVCHEVITRVDRPNIRMNFDPINFERVGVSSLDALKEIAPLVGHVHLKGLAQGEYCEFGEGDVDLKPVLRLLLGGGYQGGFSVEYEGPHDGTVRLYRSVQRAQFVIAECQSVSGGGVGGHSSGTSEGHGTEA